MKTRLFFLLIFALLFNLLSLDVSNAMYETEEETRGVIFPENSAWVQIGLTPPQKTERYRYYITKEDDIVTLDDDGRYCFTDKFNKNNKRFFLDTIHLDDNKSIVKITNMYNETFKPTIVRTTCRGKFVYLVDDTGMDDDIIKNKEVQRRLNEKDAEIGALKDDLDPIVIQTKREVYNEDNKKVVDAMQSEILDLRVKDRVRTSRMSILQKENRGLVGSKNKIKNQCILEKYFKTTLFLAITASFSLGCLLYPYLKTSKQKFLNMCTFFTRTTT